MQLSKVFSMAATLTWKHKPLWVLGLLVALGADYGWPRSALDRLDTEGLYERISGPELAWGWTTVAGLIALGVVLGLVFFVLSLIARGGLIAGVQQIEHDGDLNLGLAWRIGVKRFGRILGMSLALYLPIIIVVAAGLIFGAIWFVGAGGLQGQALAGSNSDAAAAMPAILALACALVLYGLVARGLEVLAERAIVIDELTMAQSLRKAWRMFTTNFIRVANVALALFFISGAIGIALGFTLGVVVAVPAVVGMIGLGTVLAVGVSLAVIAVFTTFVSTVWTMVYRLLLTAEEPKIQSPAAPPTLRPT